MKPLHVFCFLLLLPATIYAQQTGATQHVDTGVSLNLATARSNNISQLNYQLNLIFLP
ncbi:hypothetical protein [Pedobacter sp.]|uniref:hypothetical protein n=1 Tax=Pedobacter sp. TaxID=1411316 RepID=UPI003D7FCB39